MNKYFKQDQKKVIKKRNCSEVKDEDKQMEIPGRFQLHKGTVNPYLSPDVFKHWLQAH